jgi:hypothetical protein
MKPIPVAVQSESGMVPLLGEWDGELKRGWDGEHKRGWDGELKRGWDDEL